MSSTTIQQLASIGALEFGDGYRTKRSEHGLPGFPILRVADVANDCITPGGSDHVRVDKRSSIGSKLSRAGDVLLTTKGTVGRVAVVPEGLPELVYSPQLCYFRVLDRSTIEPGFLKHWFRSPEFRNQAMHRSVNTDMAPYINLRDIGSLEIRLPAVERQRAIADVLGALDDKIAANTRLLSRIEELASTLMRAAQSEQVPLSSLARFVNGRAFTKDATGTGRVVIRIAELNSGIGSSTVRNDLDVAEDHLARPGDLLFAWSGSLTVARWFQDEAIINQHIFKVVPSGTTPSWLVEQALHTKLTEFRAIAADKATTMGHIQRRHLDEPVAIPIASEVDRLDDPMTALTEHALAVQLENRRLTTTRDALLPLLMSGSLRVKDAEKVVSDAV